TYDIKTYVNDVIHKIFGEGWILKFSATDLMDDQQLIYVCCKVAFIRTNGFVGSNHDSQPVKDYTTKGLKEAVRRKYSNMIIELLVQGGADVNAEDRGVLTALHYAADGVRVEMLRFLVEHGADVNAKTGAGRTALHYAALRGHVEMLRF